MIAPNNNTELTKHEILFLNFQAKEIVHDDNELKFLGDFAENEKVHHMKDFFLRPPPLLSIFIHVVVT